MPVTKSLCVCVCVCAGAIVQGVYKVTVLLDCHLGNNEDFCRSETCETNLLLVFIFATCNCRRDCFLNVT